MDIKVSGHEFYYDITSMSMLFFPGEKVNYVKRSTAPVHIISSLVSENGKHKSLSKIIYNGKIYISQKTVVDGKDIKNVVKQTFFNVCSKATGIIPPWGILTGIRPLSVYERHLKSGENAPHIMKSEYFLSDDKIEILKRISECQKDIAINFDRDVSIYISVPFCPGKCSYCSFISVSAVNAKALLEAYLEKLYEEIREKSALVKKYGLRVRSLYVGGGTPGILNAEQLEKLLKTLNTCFNLNDIDEICFELGRPDTVSRSKLQILEKYGIMRICVNTQTTNDEILRAVNRNHTVSDYFRAVEAARSFNFKSINTDIIAGLPGENLSEFRKTVDDVISTGVDNITVHTLAIKRASTLRDEAKVYDPKNHNVIKMLEYAYNKLEGSGFIPYYIYKQKNCVSNGENIGFCRPEKICKYNIYMMEDVHSIIACGAGASSKIIKDGRVSRVINVKYPLEYTREYEKVHKNTDKIDDMLKADLNYE